LGGIVEEVIDVNIPSRYGASVRRMSKAMISFVEITPVRRTTRFALDWLFLG
jgi:hypothetical protein